MAKTNPSVTVLRGDPIISEKVMTSGEAIKPGMLVEVVAAGTLSKSNDKLGPQRSYAVEAGWRGGDIDTAYANGDTVTFASCRPGDHVYAWLKAGNDVGIGAELESAADGTLQAITAASQLTSGNYTYTARGVAVARALEAVDNDPGTGGAAVRIKVEVL